MRSIEDYRKIAGDEVISEIYNKARKLYGKKILEKYFCELKEDPQA